MRERALSIMFLLFIFSMFGLALNIQPAHTSSSEPPTVEWSKTYGGPNVERCLSVIETSDGGFALAGWTESFGAVGSDFLLVKTDSSGNMEWKQTYGRSSYDRARAIVETDDGGFAIAGVSGGSYWLVKTDSFGNMEWSKTYSKQPWDAAWGMTKTSDGGYALIGYTNYGSGRNSYWLVKTDSSGNKEWDKVYSRPYLDRGRGVIQTSEGGYALIGYTMDSNDPYATMGMDIWLIKTDSSGNVEWDQTYGGTYNEIARHVMETSDGGYLIPGSTTSFGVGGSDGWLVKTNPSGDVVWNQTYGGTDDDVLAIAVETSGEGYVAAGSTWSFGAVQRDGWLIKTDSLGSLLWDLTFGEANDDRVTCMVATSDGGYAIAGRTNSFGAGNYDFWLVKATSEVEPVAAKVDVDPDTLDLMSKGKWITAYVELSEDYNVSDIDVSSMRLDDAVPAELYPTETGDYDNDTIPDLMVKFNETKVVSHILDKIDIYSEELMAEKQVNVTLTIAGKLYNGSLFQGSDTIRIISPKTTVIFSASALSSSTSGTVLIVDSANYTYRDLPAEFQWEAGESYSFQWNTPLSSGLGERFVWVSTSGLSTSRNGSILVPFGEGSVSASYETQYYLKVTSACGDPNPTGGWFDAGTLIAASVSSPISDGTETLHICTGWTGTGSVPSSGNETSVTFSLDAPSNLTWNWETQKLSLFCSSSTSYAKFRVEINGNLTSGGAGLSGVPIQISYSVTGGKVWEDLTFVHTDSDGGYSAVWMPSVTGNYFIKATWEGNTTNPEMSAIVNLMVAPFKEQNVFSVASNSIVSGLVFNSTSRELSFTVTGSPGTTGRVNVHIAKTLVGNIAEVEVYLDGEQMNYTATSLDDSWLLHFTYHHSAHQIIISLGAISVPFVETQFGKVVVIGIPIMAIVALVFFLLKKRQS